MPILSRSSVDIIKNMTIYYDPRKPKPWPIRLLNKCGIHNDATAVKLVIAASVLLICLSAYFLLSAIQPVTSERDPVTESLRNI